MLTLGGRRVRSSTSAVARQSPRGAGLDQTLNPLALAFDASRTRLVVLGLRDIGMLQVLDLAPNVSPRYITKWGEFGRGSGQFLAISVITLSPLIFAMDQILAQASR